MACRSTILIDNFLTASDFNSISSRVAASEQYNDSNHHDMRDDLWTDVTNLVSVSYTHLTLPTITEV